MNYADIVRLVNSILKQYTMRLTLRQIYYRLVADHGLPNKRSSYNQLSKHLVKAREQGSVDENRIEDRTRSFLGGEDGYRNPESFLEALRAYIEDFHEQYDINLWKDQPEFTLIWVEKDALSRVIAEVADEYRVIVCPSRGYASFTYVRQAVAKLPRDKRITVLHFADHDPSGLDMTRDLERRLIRYGARNTRVERVALTYDQVQELDLMPNPTKAADPRSANYMMEYGAECWELDAIEPAKLQDLVKEGIEAHVDLQQWEDSKGQLEDEREEVKETIDKWVMAIKKADEEED